MPKEKNILQNVTQLVQWQNRYLNPDLAGFFFPKNNRMGKMREFFKKIRDTKGTFHAKMGSIKDRSGMDLTEAEDIKKRWQEYTEELYKKDLQDPNNHDGVLTNSHLILCRPKAHLTLHSQKSGSR